MDYNPASENSRLRKELKANKTAYAKLNNEKDEAIKALKQANEKIATLESLLKLKDQLLKEVREEKDKEVAELMKIKNDLEMRLQSALEDGAFELESSTQPDLSLSQGGWNQSAGHSQLTSAKAIENLKKWEGVIEITEELLNLVKEEETEGKSWKPGTPFHLKWKPHIKVYVSYDNKSTDIFEFLQNDLFPQLECFCKNGDVTISFISLITEHLEAFSLPNELAIDVSLHEVKSCDLFLGLIGNNVNNITKSEVEHGFLNNPSIRPSVFLFIDDQKTTKGCKLKQRIRGSSSHTRIIECNKVVADDVLNDLYISISTVLKTSYDIHDPKNSNQTSTFAHLSLLADMRMEYEQKDILNSILQNVPQNPVCIELTFENLKAYMTEKTTVAPYLITAPTGSGKSLLLAKWIETLERDHCNDVSVLYHFVTRSSSSSSDSCLMYRRFCHKLMLLYDPESSCASLAVDPDTQEEVFSDWLNKTAAVLEQSTVIFFVIDNAELLQDYSQLSWLHKPLPKNVRVILTVNESAQYPDSWKHLASCTLPTPNSTDLQQVLPNILYGYKRKSLTEDQTISLVIVSQYSFLWCVLAARFILSLSEKLSDSEIDDEVLPSLEDATEISELVKIILDDFESTYPSLTIAMEQIIQLIYWSRNGLVTSELQQLLQFPDITVCFIINELKNRYVLCEIAGILQFTHESVLEVVQFKYHLESLSEDLLIWPETLICFFSQLQSQLLSRCTKELPWLLKRGELQQDLANVLLNIDILIQLYCSGQGGLLLKYWRWIGVFKDSIPDQYKVELSAVEEQAGEDESSLLYVAMVMLTVGKILRNLGLIDETQPLLQRALELYESHCDPDSENIASALNELANIYTLMKKYSAAECYYNQALEIYENMYGEYSDEAIHILESLKKLYEETKKPELLDGIGTRLISLRDQRKKSKPNAHMIIIKYLSTLEKRLNSYDNDQLPDAEYVKCLNQWAVLHAAFGQGKSADDYFYTALSISEDVLGNDHPQTVCILKNWTMLHWKMEKFSEAITLQWRIVEIKEKLGEINDISFANILSDLADLHFFNNNYKKTVALYDRAIEIYVLQYGHSHPKVQSSMEKRELASQKILAL